MASPEVAWIAELDVARVERRVGADAVDRSLEEPRGYASPPRVDAAGRLSATTTREGWRGNVQVGRTETQNVAVRIRGESLELSCTCPRGGKYLCEHVTALLVDVAVHAPLREALVAGTPTDRAVDALPTSRKLALEERTLDERLARWLPPRAEDELEIDVEVTRAAGAASPDERPALLLRVRRPSSRALTNPRELLATRLPARYRKLLELTTPSSLHQGALVSTRAAASLLLHLLAEDGSARTGSFKERLRFAREPLAPVLVKDDERLVARWARTDGTPVSDAADALLFAGPFPHVWCERLGVFHPVAADVDLDVAWGMSVVPSLPIHGALAERVGRALLGRARGAGIALPQPEAFGLPPLEKPSFVLRLSGSPLAVLGDLEAVYSSARIRLSPSAREDRDVATGRDLEAEERAIALCREAGLDTEERGAFTCSEDRAVELWREGLARLRSAPDASFEIVVSDALARVRVGPPVTVRVHVGVASGWLETELDFTSASLKAEIALLHAAIVRKQRWIELTDGTLAQIGDDVRALVEDAAPHFAAGSRASLPPHQLGRVEAWVARFGGDVDKEVRALGERLRAQGVAAKPELPRELTATLRPYQEQGLAWLQFLEQLGAGGVLADDMARQDAHDARVPRPVEGARRTRAVARRLPDFAARELGGGSDALHPRPSRPRAPR